MELNNNHPINIENDIDCHVNDLLFVDFIDGILPVEKSKEIQLHIDNCPGCRNFYQLLLNSKTITGKLQKNRNEYIKGISYFRKKQGINRITRIIESDNSSRQKNKPIFAFTLRNWAYASTAAGIAVLLFVVYLFFGSGNADFRDSLKTSININEEFPVDDKGKEINSDAKTESGKNDYLQEGTKSSEINETTQSSAEVTGCSGSTSSSPYDKNTSGKDAITATSKSASTTISSAASKSATTSAASPTAAPSSESSDTSKNAAITNRANGVIKIESGNTQEIWLALQGFISYHEITNSENSYLSIAAYPLDIIDIKKNTIMQIAVKMDLTAKFEIISGENTQKLVEYISEENAMLLSKNAVSNNAGFLVISIGR